jgi:hypothetical protein
MDLYRLYSVQAAIINVKACDDMMQYLSSSYCLSNRYSESEYKSLGGAGEEKKLLVTTASLILFQKENKEIKGVVTS